MAEVEIQLMGPLRVVVDGQEVSLPRSRKARALLAMLALEPWDHPRSSLCAHLWPDTADPRADLRWSLSKLRGVLGAEAIVSTGGDLRLNPDVSATDVARLEALLAGDVTPEVVEALTSFEARASSAPLADLDAGIGVEFELWLESRRHGLARLLQRMLAALAESSREEPDRALELTRRRLALDPLNEAAALDLLELTLRHAGRQQAQAVLEQCRTRLRHAGLPDSRLLATWRRLGQPLSDTLATALVEPATELVWSPPQKPSVAVLGFENLGDRADALLAQGLSVDLTSSLSRLRGLFVIARASAARFRLSETPPAEIGRQLGVRYLVHGSTRRLGHRLRVTVELMECGHGEVIWSEHVERPLGDLFLVQDEVVDAIVSALEPQIEQAERERARLLPTEDLNAWECFHRAMWHTYRFTRDDTLEAQRLLQRALSRDSGFARAHAGLSFTYFARAFLHASDDLDADVSRAVESARESVSLEPRDAIGHWSLGRALLLSGSHDQALAAIDRSLAANPSYAQGHYARGFVGCHSGIAGEIYGDLDMAQRLSPFDPLLFAMESCRAISLAVTGRYEEAARWATRATEEPNAHFHIHAIAAVCLQLAGRHPEAAGKVGDVLEMYPEYSVRVFERSFPHKSEHDRRVMSDALAAAGLRR